VTVLREVDEPTAIREEASQPGSPGLRAAAGDEAAALGRDAERRAARRRFVLAWLGLTLGLGLLLFFYKYLGEVTEGAEGPWLFPLITELTGAVGAGLLYLGLRPFIRRFPLDTGRAARRIPFYLVALALFAFLHTTWMWASRSVLIPLAGLGRYDYGRMPLRYFMELPVQIVTFTIIVAATHAVRRLRAARERELRTAQLESSLARSELRNLRLQLQPHFLFNALNTISSRMYEDPEAADEMLDRLAELLRISLRTAQTDEVPLTTELETLERYLAIMRARFGDRLDVEVAVEPAARAAVVPSMILQPLVENAVRHGNAERTGRGSIRVRVAREDGALSLEVRDDGPGAAAGRDVLARGTGLSATAERLHLLYGAAARFEAGNVPGGFRARALLPFRTPGDRGEAPE